MLNELALRMITAPTLSRAMRGGPVKKEAAAKMVLEYAGCFYERSKTEEGFEAIREIAASRFVELFDGNFRPGYHGPADALCSQAIKEAREAFDLLEGAAEVLMQEEQEREKAEAEEEARRQRDAELFERQEELKQEQLERESKEKAEAAKARADAEAEIERRRKLAEDDAKKDQPSGDATSTGSEPSDDERADSPQKKLLATPVKDLDIPGRAVLAFAKAGLSTVEELLAWRETQSFEKVNGIGDDFAEDTEAAIDQVRKQLGIEVQE